MLKLLTIFLVVIFGVIDYVLAKACTMEDDLSSEYLEDAQPATRARCIDADDLLAIMTEETNKLLKSIGAYQSEMITVESNYDPQDFPELVSAANGTLTFFIDQTVREAKYGR